MIEVLLGVLLTLGATAWIIGGTFFGFHTGMDRLAHCSGLAQVLGGLAAGLLAPLIALLSVRRGLRMTRHACGEIRDTLFPKKVRLPKAQVIRRHDEPNAGNFEQGAP